jgi:hypothetical protein
LAAVVPGTTEVTAAVASSIAGVEDTVVVSAPATLLELATVAGVEEADFADFSLQDFEDLTKELGVSTVARVKLRNQFKFKYQQQP